MDTIQTDISDEALVTAIRANMCDFFRYISRSDPTENFERERFTRWYTPLQHPWFNGMLCSKTPADGDTAFIDETINYFKSKKVNTFTWWMEPHLKRSDWEPLLSRSSFGFSDDSPGMAVDLHLLDESTQKVDGLKIRAVEDDGAGISDDRNRLRPAIAAGGRGDDRGADEVDHLEAAVHRQAGFFPAQARRQGGQGEGAKTAEIAAG